MASLSAAHVIYKRLEYSFQCIFLQIFPNQVQITNLLSTNAYLMLPVWLRNQYCTNNVYTQFSTYSYLLNYFSAAASATKDKMAALLCCKGESLLMLRPAAKPFEYAPYWEHPIHPPARGSLRCHFYTFLLHSMLIRSLLFSVGVIRS